MCKIYILLFLFAVLEMEIIVDFNGVSRDRIATGIKIVLL